MIEKNYPVQQWAGLPEDIKKYLETAVAKPASIKCEIVHGYNQENGENFSTLKLEIRSKANYNEYNEG